MGDDVDAEQETREQVRERLRGVDRTDLLRLYRDGTADERDAARNELDRRGRRVSPRSNQIARRVARGAAIVHDWRRAAAGDA